MGTGQTNKHPSLKTNNCQLRISRTIANAAVHADLLTSIIFYETIKIG